MKITGITLITKQEYEKNKSMAIFNFIVEIYKPLIKEYHTSTLMALA